MALDFMDTIRAVMRGGRFKYSPLPPRNPVREVQASTGIWSDRHKSALKFTMAAMFLLVVGYMVIAFMRVVECAPTCAIKCDTPQKGFQCSPEISHFWGQYSPFFSVPSELSPSVPAGCEITFAQILSRHGARDPTASKTKLYQSTINRIHSSATSYGKGYEFIKDYEYTLGADQLTTFGQQELINSGIKFYARYKDLASISPFVRSSGQDRVVESAMNWTQGFHQARLADKQSTSPDSYPYDIVTISEDAGMNNSLSHSICTAFEDGPVSEIGDDAQSAWLDVFVRSITNKLNANLPGANISAIETIYLMDLCPFNTVASTDGSLSPFCGLFSKDEWEDYDYLQSLNKWYGYGNGNPLGPTQGVAFTNELIARLTDQPVVDHTATNTTMDSDPADFPLGKTLYADFSHDNDMTAIFAALGLYNATAQLSNTTRESTAETKGYSASWTVPFAARMYVEKMTCSGSTDELVRILVNDRVIPLGSCGADALGRCTLDNFVSSLSFARSGGHWDQCFV